MKEQLINSIKKGLLGPVYSKKILELAQKELKKNNDDK